jgi:hypothetical protein
MREREASDEEVESAILRGERFLAKFGRQGFRLSFPFGAE